MPVALVTGAASGIGRATSIALDEAGWTVAELDVPMRRDQGAEVGVPISTNVTDPDAVASAVAQVEDRVGPLGAVVTAAGILEESEIGAISDEDWRRMLAVHLDGTFLVCRAAATAMVARRAGAIVTVSSELALSGQEGHAHYCAAKGAVIAFTKSIALELAPLGLRANVVAPGPTDTPLLTDRWRRPEYVETLPVRRIASPEEIAAAILFLLSDDAEYFIGEVLSPNCGAVM